MKIPAKLPQFLDKSALFLVSGIQAADFYLASEGEMNKVGQVVLVKAHYSDRENFGRNGSRVFESGDRVDKLKKDKRRDFLELMKKTIKELSLQKKVGIIYLLAPAEIVEDIKEVLPPGWEKKIIGIFEGNFHKEKPLDILKKTAVKKLK